MSHEKSLSDTIVADYPEPNLNYEEYMNNVKISEDSNETPKEPAKGIKPNAQDEVVSILLSAMMGSIVKTWKIRPTRVESRLSSTDVEKQEVISSRIFKTSEFADYLSEGKKTVRESNHPTFADEDLIKFRGTENNLDISESKKKETVHTTYTTHTTHTSRNTRTTSTTRGTRASHATRTTFEDSPARKETTLEDSDEDKEDPTAALKKLRESLINNQDGILGWEFLDCDREFLITFKQGNRYEGKLLNCRMHGEGKFYWANGSLYEGEFFLGQMTGKGKLSWQDGSWYEGELRRGYRDGRGLYVQAPSFYAGYWRCGRRHGVGAMYYTHFDTRKHHYNGEWRADKKHGTGLRCYPSGAMYSGQWRSGRRHGLGTMVWTARDVYSGNFRHGRMHGYGEYTWDTFRNQQLVVAEENCYYGEWWNNVRHGNGTLETTAGVVVKGSWKKGKKHGPAEVICSNGNFLYDDNLFNEDNLCLPDSNLETDSLNASVQTLYKLPVSAACHEINLGYYVARLAEFMDECVSLGKPLCFTPIGTNKVDETKRTFSFNRNLEPEENKMNFKQEETYVRNVLMQFLSNLKVIYTTYSQVCCDPKPTFPTVLMRIMWWQLLRDCGLHSRGYSLVDFDICIANNKACLVQGLHYPFERLLFWQFLHCLIEVSWELYGKKCEGTPSIKGMIASGLHRLITDDLIPNVGRHKGNALFNCRDLLSFDALYWYYRGIGEPHSAREFLKQASEPRENGDAPDNDPDYYEYQIRGKNVIGVGGKLTYFPKEEPLLASNKYRDDPTSPKDLSCLSDLGLGSILECILQVCPSVASGDLLVNMDYKIVFLEFYEILLLCATKKAKMNILQDKQKVEKVESQIETLESNHNTVEESLPAPEQVPQPSEGKKSQRKKSSPSKKPKKKKS